jgi:hypothetical protein
MSIALRPDPGVVIVDSVTHVSGDVAGLVLVTGSHGGVNAALYAAATGAKAVLFNDAGVGKDSAGIAGLAPLELYDVAAAAVAHTSAQIGRGVDTYEAGIISHVNVLALVAGVTPGMTAGRAAELFAAREASDGVTRPAAPKDDPPVVLGGESAPVVVFDSISQADARYAGTIAVTGSHGGVVDGHAVVASVAAAFFNDAGVGKGGAGVTRLVMLDRIRIPGVTVDYRTARIGEGLDTYENGVVSHINVAAARMGVAVGQSVPLAVETLAAAITPVMTLRRHRYESTRNAP